jgi:hypothetical protein
MNNNKEEMTIIAALISREIFIYGIGLVGKVSK